MTQTITAAPIRKTVRVAAAPARAFDIFANGTSRWWLKNFSISLTKSPIKDIILEPRAGGRWYERGEDGTECPWGQVLAWEPPSRLLLAWQINHEFKYDPALMTEVEVRFTPDGSGTLVELEHRLLERMGDGTGAMRERFTQGWGALIGSFAQHAS